MLGVNVGRSVKERDNAGKIGKTSDEYALAMANDVAWRKPLGDIEERRFWP